MRLKGSCHCGERHFCWVRLPAAKGDKRFRGYPRQAVVEWHRKRGLLKP